MMILSSNSPASCHGLSSQKSRFFSRVVVFTLCLFSLGHVDINAQSVDETIPAGSYIINMGVEPQTVDNALKPYGLLYELLSQYQVPVRWVIRDDKGRDEYDFIYNGAIFKGGPFIVLADYRSATIDAIIAKWEALGVVGVTTTSEVTVPVFTTIDYFMNWTLDEANGSKAEAYLIAAGIPSTGYNWVLPNQLSCCDDIFVMPHADPVWETHGRLFNWTKDIMTTPDGCDGSVWSACHAVSALENAFNPADPSQQLNFLSEKSGDGNPSDYPWADNSLILWGDHSNGDGVYKYGVSNHPVMQFLGDATTESGSESIYLPHGAGWRPETKIGIWDDNMPDVISSDDKHRAAKFAFGDAHADPTSGKVMYEAGHTHAGTISGMRAFFNFSFWAVQGKAIKVTTAGYPANGLLDERNSPTLSAAATGGTGVFSYQWVSTCGGTFSNPNGATTTWTPDDVSDPTNCAITCIVMDDCGTRSGFSSEAFTVVPAPQPPVANDDNGLANPGVVITLDIIGNDTDPNLDIDNSSFTFLSSTTTPNGGTFTYNNDGSINYVSANGFIGTDTISYVICDETEVGETPPGPYCDTALITIVVNLQDENGCFPTQEFRKVYTGYGDGLDTFFIADTRATPQYGLGYPDANAIALAKNNEWLVIDLTDTIPQGDTVFLLISHAGVGGVADISGSIMNSGFSGLLSHNITSSGSADFEEIPYIVSQAEGLRYIRVERNSTIAIYIDAVKYNKKNCEPLCNSPLTSYFAFGSADAVAAGNTENNAASTTGFPDKVGADLNIGEILIIDLGETITTTATIELYLAQNNGAIPTIEVSASLDNTDFSGATNFVPSADRDESYNQFFYTITTPIGARFIKITSADATGYVDAIVYDINTCIDNTPVANDDVITIIEDHVLAFNILSNDYDIQGDELTPSITVAPSNGTAFIASDGTLSYTPNPDFSGTEVITYQICDPNGLCDIATVTITVVQDGCGSGDGQKATIVGMGYGFTAMDNTFVTNKDRALGYPNGAAASAGLAANAVESARGELTIAFSSSSFAGDSIIYYLASDKANNPIDWSISISSNGTDFVDEYIGAMPTGSIQRFAYFITNPSGATHVRIKNASASKLLLVDAIEYTRRECMTDCVLPTVRVSETGNGSIQTNYAVGSPDNVLGSPDGIGAQVGYDTKKDISDTLWVDLGTNIPQGGKIYLYLAHNGTASDISVMGSLDNSTFSNETIFSPQLQTYYQQFVYTVDQALGVRYIKLDKVTATILVDAVEYYAMDCVDATPVANNDALTICEDANPTYIVQGNDTDPFGRSLTTVIVTGPSNGSASLNNDGSISYNPNQDYNGTEVITYKVCNMLGLCSENSTLTITIVDDGCLLPGEARDVVGATVINLEPSDDAYIVENSSIKHFSQCVNLDIFDRNGQINRSILKFDLSTIPASAVISSAFLRLTMTGGNADLLDVDLHELSTSWSEQALGCNTDGDPSWSSPWGNGGGDFGPIVTTTNVGIAGTYDWEITNLVNQWAYGGTNNGILIKLANEIDSRKRKTFGSQENITPANRPQLVINYVDYACTGACNTPPIAQDDNDATINSSPVDIHVLADNDNGLDSDPNGDNLIISEIISNPNFGTATIDDGGTPGDPSDDFITYDPQGIWGEATFEYLICDDGAPVLCDTATVTVTVTNTPPVAQDDAITGTYNTTENIDVFADNGNGIDSEPESHAITITEISLDPENGFASINNNGTPGDPTDDFIEYTPYPGFIGTDTLEYVICDPYHLCDTAEVVITIPNTTPTTGNDVGIVTACTALEIDVLDNDTDAEGQTLTVTQITSGPSDGTAVINFGTTITYYSDPGYSGADAFTYEVCDNNSPVAGCNTATVNITVSGSMANNAPTAVDDTADPVIVGDIAYIPVKNNDSDPEGTALTVSIPGNPNMSPSDVGILDVLSNGMIKFTQTGDYVGTVTFDYRICDNPETLGSCPTSAQECTTATVTLVIENQAPLAINDESATALDTPVDIDVLGNDGEPDGQTISLTGAGTDDPPTNLITTEGGTVALNNNGTPGDPSDDYIVYNPAIGFTGVDTFYYEICDDVPNPNTLCDVAMVTVEVTAPVDIRLTKTVVATDVNLNDAVTFTITAINSTDDITPADATGVIVQDQIPSGLNVTGATPSDGSYDSGSGIWYIGDLSSGASATLTMNATVTDFSNATNIAEAYATDQSDYDSTPNNNDPSEDDQASIAPGNLNGTDIEIVKTAVGIFIKGQTATYQIVVTNNGPNGATGISVTDNIPGAFGSSTWTAIFTGGGTGTAAGSGNISQSIDLPSSATATYTITGTVDMFYSGSTLDNTASVSFIDDNSPLNNLSTASPTVIGCVEPVVGTEIPTHPSCTSAGSIVITATGPTNIEYSIDNGTTWQLNDGTFSDLAPGTYILKLRDADIYGCEISGSVLILTDPGFPIVETEVSSSPTSCGVDDGTIAITASGVTNFDYSIDGGSSWQSSATFSALGAGNFNVAVRNNDLQTCITTGSTISLNSPTLLRIDSEVKTDPTTCEGTDATITITASGVTNIDYSIDGGSSWQTTGTYTGLSSGSYDLQVRDRDNPSCVAIGCLMVIADGCADCTPPAKPLAILRK